MIRSMTGFGRASFELAGVAFDLEMRAVNHRYLDVRIKLPRLLSSAEPALKAQVQGRLQRGKVDVTISPVGNAAQASSLQLDETVVDQYVAAARRLVVRAGVTGELDVNTLIGLPGVTRFDEPGIEESELEQAVGAAMGRALDALEAMREREGEALLRDFETRLDRILALTEGLEARSDDVVQAVREKLRKRAHQLEQETGLLDEARLHQELVVAADRMDVREELVRLRSHVEQFRAIVAEAGPTVPVGRRLDFLLQELGREANTIGSKAADAPLAHDVVELKTELERIREQVQNLE